MSAKVPVTVRALIQRINRRLEPGQEMLKQARGPRAEQEVGKYFVVDLRHNAITRHDVDLEQFGRQVAALKPFEQLSE